MGKSKKTKSQPPYKMMTDEDEITMKKTPKGMPKKKKC